MIRNLNFKKIEFFCFKIRIKCKNTKLEQYLQNWYNFNRVCSKLDAFFSSEIEIRNHIHVSK